MDKYKIVTVVQIFGMIISAAVAAYSDASTIYRFPTLGDWHSGLLFGNLAFIAFVLWFVLMTVWGIRPKIDVDSVQEVELPINAKETESGLTYTSNTTITTVTNVSISGLGNKRQAKFTHDTGEKARTYSFALVGYKNDPVIHANQATAKKVIAGVWYYDENMNPLIGGNRIIARWWDEPEPKDILPDRAPHTLQEVDIPPSGMKVRWLVIAMKHVLEEDFFAYSLDSIKHNEWRKREYVLGKGKKNVQVIVAGANFPNVERWFCVSQLENKKIKIDRIDKPKIGRRE